jgi:hypothetical protein
MGGSAEAVQKLLATSKRARDMGLLSYQLQARLAISEIPAGATNGTTSKEKARADLESLRRDAAQSNYKLIRRHAEALLAARSVR